jgi:hypothetical protein
MHVGGERVAVGAWTVFKLAADAEAFARYHRLRARELQGH